MLGLFFSAFSAAAMPSSWGMFVYRDDTSMDASMAVDGMCVCSIIFINSFESFRNDGSCFISGCSQWSMNSLMFSVMLLQEETMGRSFIGVLCIFFKKYSAAVRWFVGGLQNSSMAWLISPCLVSKFSFCMMMFLTVSVGSVVSGLYTDVSFRCFVFALCV